MKENNLENRSLLGIKIDEDKMIINSIPSKKKQKFDRIIISYNFKKNNYFIDDCELEGYENKEFLLNTLYNFNSQPIFKYDSPYIPTCIERMFFLIPVILLFLIIIYILYILSVICTFNPIIIYLSILCVIMTYKLIIKFKNTLNEKYKKKAINKIINDTNESEYCKSHHIKFKLGLSGYWLEVETFVEEDNELEKFILK